MTEKEMFNELKKSISVFVKVYSIETSATEIGIPDVLYVGDYFMGWLELKQNNRLKIKYRPNQQNTLKLFVSKKITAYTLFYYKENYYLLNDFSITKFKNIDHLEEVSVWKGDSLYDYLFIEKLKNN